jgi:4-amino-4-deoxy-L-arabinose transferase-like glycosyltransferase
MSKISLHHFPRLPAMLLLLASLFILGGLAQVPFHPDESTYLYMSSDLELFIQDPLSMRYDPAVQEDARQRYRLLDAPLGRLAIGVARRLAGYAALPSDWNWRRIWEVNVAAGALPASDLLLAGRLATSLLGLLALICLYQAGRRMDRPLTGWLAAGFLALNALYLLHARRAMAEGPLLLGVCLALWGFIDGERRPWLAGLGAALALNAKQSALPLLPVGLLAVVWLVDTSPALRWRRRLYNAMQYLLVLTILTAALNPWLWRQPVVALRAALAERNRLLALQVADMREIAPQQVLDTAGERLMAVTAHLFLTSPSFAEVGNYRSATASAEAAYLSNPLHSLLRGTVGGVVLLVLFLLGLSLALANLRRVSPSQRRVLVLVLLAGALQLAAIVAAVPLAWQRYVIPLLPFVCLWAAYALRNPGRANAPGTQTSESAR